MEQGVSLCMMPCAPTTQPAQMVIRPFAAAPVLAVPQSQPAPYHSAPSTSADPRSNLQSVREHASSHGPANTAAPVAQPMSALVPPHMANRTTGEQAVIAALQAVANYPESRGYVQAAADSMPGLRTLLDASRQVEKCMSKSQGSRPSTSVTRDLSPVSNEELGRKRTLPPRSAGAASHADSPTSGPPPDKQRQAEPTLRSVVIPQSVGYQW